VSSPELSLTMGTVKVLLPVSALVQLNVPVVDV
jgi:hypothetical protein